MDDELIPEFIEESKNSLANIEADLLKLESDKSVDAECVNRVFRAMHTIKGAGSFLQLGNIVSVSHRAESLLTQIRDGETLPTPETVGIILDAVDAITSMLSAEDLGEKHDFHDLLQRLEDIVQLKKKTSGTQDGEFESGNSDTFGTPDLADGDVNPERIASPGPASTRATAIVTNAPATRISDPTMRVPASVLNHLLQITGGMVMARNQLLNTTDHRDNPLSNA